MSFVQFWSWHATKTNNVNSTRWSCSPATTNLVTVDQKPDRQGRVYTVPCAPWRWRWPWRAQKCSGLEAVCRPRGSSRPGSRRVSQHTPAPRWRRQSETGRCIQPETKGDHKNTVIKLFVAHIFGTYRIWEVGCGQISVNRQIQPQTHPLSKNTTANFFNKKDWTHKPQSTSCANESQQEDMAVTAYLRPVYPSVVQKGDHSQQTAVTMCYRYRISSNLDKSQTLTSFRRWSGWTPGTSIDSTACRARLSHSVFRARCRFSDWTLQKRTKPIKRENPVHRLSMWKLKTRKSWQIERQYSCH